MRESTASSCRWPACPSPSRTTWRSPASRCGSARPGSDPAPQQRDHEVVRRLRACRRGGRRGHARPRAVRLRDHRLDVRHHPQPLGPRPFAGRLVGWIGGSRRLRHRAGGARQRRHGVDPHPGGLLRAGRDQAGTGRGARRPRRRLLVRDGRERSARDHRRRRRTDALRAGRPTGARHPCRHRFPAGCASPPGSPARPRSAGHGGPQPPRAQTCSARPGTGWSRRTRPTVRCWPSPSSSGGPPAPSSMPGSSPIGPSSSRAYAGTPRWAVLRWPPGSHMRRDALAGARRQSSTSPTTTSC